MIRRSDIDLTDLIAKIESKNFSERFSIFIWGVLIYALSFSMFFSPHNIVTGSSSGLSIIISYFFNIDMSLFIFVFSAIILVIGYLFLGKSYTIKSIFGVVIFPIFVKFTSIFPEFIDLSESSLCLIVFFGGLLMGLGNGIIMRSGFSTGGFQTIFQMFYKYFGISIGKSNLIINGILVFISGFFFGFSNVLYAIIGLYISSIVTDRVMLETSISKTFFIVTKKEKEINEYITDVLGHSATILKARGGYTNNSQRIIMCSVPTRQYYSTKQVIQNIDKNAFFLITDTYEIYGGM